MSHCVVCWLAGFSDVPGVFIDILIFVVLVDTRLPR